MSDALNSDLFLEIIGKMIDDQFEVLADTQRDHDRRVRAFLLMTMAASIVPNDETCRELTTRIQQRIQGLPPVDMINVIHVCADSMTTMMAMGMNPPPGTFGGLG